MKTKIISKLKKEILLVKLPEHGGYNLNKNRIAFYDNFKKERLHIKGSYTLLGTPDEIKEEDVKDLVEQSIFTSLYGHYVSGIDVNTYCYKTAIKSFHSALESEIYWDVNPFEKPDNYDLWSKYGDYTQYGVGLTTDSLKWHEAQEKTFDRSRTLIFVKN